MLRLIACLAVLLLSVLAKEQPVISDEDSAPSAVELEKSANVELSAEDPNPKNAGPSRIAAARKDRGRKKSSGNEDPSVAVPIAAKISATDQLEKSERKSKGTVEGIAALHQEEEDITSLPDMPTEEDDVTLVPVEPTEQEGITPRLPTNVRPIQYNLLLNLPLPSSGKQDFSAKVIIELEVIEATKSIELRASSDMHVGLYSWTKTGAEQRNAVAGSQIDTLGKLHENDRLILTAEDTIEPGKYTLSLSYEARMCTDDDGQCNGVFVTSYEYEPGKRAYAISTQFHFDRAHSALPCFDEPEYKAVFKVSIIHPEKTVAMSNGKRGEGGQMKAENCTLMTLFEPTPKMSTYLLTFAVLEGFDEPQRLESHREGFDVNATYAPTCFAGEHSAFQSTGRLLQFFEDYFGMPIAVSKLDFLFHKFARVGMEGWGLITLNEGLCRRNEEERLLRSGFTSKRMNAVAHEVTHQWLGNLVTPKWWDEFWLSEGFSTLFSIETTCKKDLCADCCEGSADEEFALLMASVRDQLEGNQDVPIVETGTPLIDVANFQVSKTVHFGKAALVIRMVKCILGEERFKQAIQIYLQKYQYGVATRWELYDAFNEVLDSNDPFHKIDGKLLDFKTVLDPWVTLKSYPIVKVELVAAHPSATGQPRRVYRFTQRPANPEMDQKKDHWYVPIWYDIVSLNSEGKCERRTERMWLAPGGCVEKSVPAGNPDEHLQVDPNACTLLLTDHTEQVLDLHAKYSECFNETERNRANDDLLTLAKKGEISYKKALPFVRKTGVPNARGVILLDQKLQEMVKWTKNCGKICKYASQLFSKNDNDSKLKLPPLIKNLRDAIVKLWMERSASHDCKADAATEQAYQKSLNDYSEDNSKFLLRSGENSKTRAAERPANGAEADEWLDENE